MTLLFDLCIPERANLWFLRPVYTPPGLCVCLCACLLRMSRLKIYFTLFLTVVLDSRTVIACKTRSLVIGLVNSPKSFYLSIPLFILTKQKNSFEFPQHCGKPHLALSQIYIYG